MADEQPAAPPEATAEAALEATAATNATPTDAPTASEDMPTATPGEANAPVVAEAPAEAAEASAPADDRLATLEAQLTALEAELDREREQSTSYMRHWHEAQADLANFKRRAQQERDQRERLVVAQAHAPTLHALDSLERAFVALPTTLRGFSWIEGIALVELQLRRALDLQGIHAVAAEPGQPFDPQRHEAIGEVESAEVPEGAIAVVAQRGYEANGLLIRPALVQVARKPAPTSPGDQSSPAADGEGQDATEATPGT